jgi:alpha-galactosidase
MRKLTIVGAGSAMFTRGLVADAIRSNRGRAWQIALVDTEPVILEAMRSLAARMVDAAGAAIRIAASTDRRDLLPGSDYVVITVGVGGRRSWEQDVVIPRRYGVFQPVGDSVLPGGISRALRMIPALVGIVRDAVALCPGARILNYANPMTANCLGILRATGVTVTGLCHGTWHTEGSLAAFAGLPRNEVSSLAVGLNHLTFLYDFRHRGIDAWPLVRERLAAMDGQPPADPFCWELFETCGAFPAPGDRHVTEFFPERFPGGRYEGKILGIDAFSFEDTIRMGDAIHDEVLALARAPGALPPEVYGHAAGEHEQLMDIIDSIESDRRAVFSVNLPNRGAVAGLPDEAVLELPAAAAARGFMPLAVRDFPPALAALLARHVDVADLVVEAALRGDRSLVVEAVRESRCLPDPKKAPALVDELIAAERRYLPQFA